MRSIAMMFWLIVGSGLLVAQVFFSAPFTASAAEHTPAAAATWAMTQIDLGLLPADAPIVHEFVVQNTGTEELVIQSVKPSCGCTVAEYTETAIAPGAYGYVTATYGSPKVGTFTKSVSVVTSADEAPIVLLMRGEVVAAK